MTELPVPPYPSTPPPPSRRPDGPPAAPSYPQYPGYPQYPAGPTGPNGFPPGYGATPPPATPDSPTDPGRTVLDRPDRPDHWSAPFYATGPHQPPYRPHVSGPPAGRYDEGSLLDLHPVAARDQDRTGPSRVLLALVGLGALVLLAAVTVVVVSVRHQGTHPAGAPTITASTTAPPTPAGPASTRPTTAPGTTAPSTTKPASAAAPAEAAARTIDRDITRSVAARKLIGPANTHIRACTAGASDMAALRRAARTRTDLVAALARLDVSSLPGGARVVADLRSAWTYSARADFAYAAWGQAHRNCSGHARTSGDPNWDRAHRNDLRSTAAKKLAVQDWNPVAARYHFGARSASTI